MRIPTFLRWFYRYRRIVQYTPFRTALILPARRHGPAEFEFPQQEAVPA